MKLFKHGDLALTSSFDIQTEVLTVFARFGDGSKARFIYRNGGRSSSSSLIVEGEDSNFVSQLLPTMSDFLRSNLTAFISRPQLLLSYDPNSGQVILVKLPDNKQVASLRREPDGDLSASGDNSCISLLTFLFFLVE